MKLGLQLLESNINALRSPIELDKAERDRLAWGQKLSIQGRASFSGSRVEEDRRVNQRVLNFPIAANPIFSLAIAKKPHSSCHKSTSSKACPAWHSA